MRKRRPCIWLGARKLYVAGGGGAIAGIWAAEDDPLRGAACQTLENVGFNSPRIQEKGRLRDRSQTVRQTDTYKIKELTGQLSANNSS